MIFCAFSENFYKNKDKFVANLWQILSEKVDKYHGGKWFLRVYTNTSILYTVNLKGISCLFVYSITKQIVKKQGLLLNNFVKLSKLGPNCMFWITSASLSWYLFFFRDFFFRRHLVESPYNFSEWTKFLTPLEMVNRKMRYFDFISLRFYVTVLSQI